MLEWCMMRKIIFHQPLQSCNKLKTSRNYKFLRTAAMIKNAHCTTSLLNVSISPKNIINYFIVIHRPKTKTIKLFFNIAYALYIFPFAILQNRRARSNFSSLLIRFEFIGNCLFILCCTTQHTRHTKTRWCVN
jgi:hypothetical protein